MTSSISLHLNLALLYALIVQSSCAIAQMANKNELYTDAQYSSAFTNPIDNPNLPNILLIGDSISIGYTIEVRKLLKQKADVFRIPTNGRHSAFGLNNIDKWLGNRKWDVIHFNWGL